MDPFDASARFRVTDGSFYRTVDVVVASGSAPFSGIVMVLAQPNETVRDVRERFLSIVDRLLPLIDCGGWQQLKDPGTRHLIDRLAKYAGWLGFKYPPLSFRITSESSRSGESGLFGFPRFRPCVADCREVEHVVVNRPYMPNVTDVKLPEVQSVNCGDPCHDSDCQPTHCIAYDALCDWRHEVQAIPVEAPTSKRHGPPKKRRKRKPRTVPTSKQTEAYNLHLKGLTLADIGVQLGISGEAVRKRINGAKKILDCGCRSVRATQSLPTDKRGQELVQGADNDQAEHDVHQPFSNPLR